MAEGLTIQRDLRRKRVCLVRGEEVIRELTEREAQLLEVSRCVLINGRIEVIPPAVPARP